MHRTIVQRQYLVNFVLGFYKTLHLLWRCENFHALMELGPYVKKLGLSFEQKIKHNEIFENHSRVNVCSYHGLPMQNSI